MDLGLLDEGDLIGRSLRPVSVSDSQDDQLELTWDSTPDREALKDELVAARDRLADAARDARWAEVFALLDEPDPWPLVDVNSIRVGGASGFAPLHQAAWHGSDDEVVGNLLARGAWRSLTTTAGETAADIARRRGHMRLAERLTKPRPTEFDTRLADLETYLAALITVRTRSLDKAFRMPQLGPLDEHPRARFWCAIAGMYGGFAYRWLDPDDRSVLLVESWSRVVGGSGQRHHVSHDGVVLVEEGFV